ncbi:MAG: bifunctional UDP-N-acetylglucosamine diphosphorylase/glucosamine-1-phosphate N-acetyltransferase GlmU [Thermoleophilaceae bacterium]
MAEQFTALIMAAGHGTRMHSELPKVLHPVCGKPMVEWVIDAARSAGAARVVCVTRPGDGVGEHLPDSVEVAEQSEGEGTGAAVLAAESALGDGGPVVILSGDHPLVSAETIAELVRAHGRDGAAATLLTTERLDPAGYGRIVRSGDGSVERIVETKHTEGLPAEELSIREINLGTYAFESGELMSALEAAGGEHGERYLTGAIPVLRERGARIVAHTTDDLGGAHGVNDRVGLMEVERLARRRLVEGHARAGVTFVDPDATYVDAGVEIGADTVVAPATWLRGSTRVGHGCQIGPHSTLIDTRVGDGAGVVQSWLVACEVHDRATIGPFSYVRPGTIVREGAKVGAFVEVKNSDIGRGAKVPHLSYIGDADVGEESNLGAGTITANLPHRVHRKERTKLGKRVKTGINTSLMAPLNVGDRAYTGAGSVIAEDVPEGALGIARPEQRNIEGYSERVEEKDSGE